MPLADSSAPTFESRQLEVEMHLAPQGSLKCFAQASLFAFILGPFSGRRAECEGRMARAQSSAGDASAPAIANASACVSPAARLRS
jgi:hypothetical protein